MNDEVKPGAVERIDPPQRAMVPASAFHSIQAFENAQRMANALARSDLVPQNFRGNLANCIIALEMAQRIGASPLAVMQNLNIIHGRPSWGAQFVIAALNSCGLFSPLRFKVSGEAMAMQCHVECLELATGEVLVGPTVSMAMAEREGWLRDKPTRDGGTMVSKWKTMQDIMIRYRAATYFGRLYAPHVLMGMRTMEELIDTSDETPTLVPAGDAPPLETQTTTEKLNTEIRGEGRKRKRAEKADEPKAAEAPPESESAAPPAEPEVPAAAASAKTDFF